MPHGRLSRSAIALLSLLVGLSTFAAGQKDTGAIVGVVRDASGAIVPKARISVTDLDRGTVFRAESSDAGEYVAGPLHIGHYRVRVEKPGFKTAEVAPVEVNV